MPSEKMSMFEFEKHLDEIKEPKRVICEALQLENYIFGEPVIVESPSIANSLHKPYV
jgi:hypothetical protein